MGDCVIDFLDNPVVLFRGDFDWPCGVVPRVLSLGGVRLVKDPSLSPEIPRYSGREALLLFSSSAIVYDNKCVRYPCCIDAKFNCWHISSLLNLSEVFVENHEFFWLPAECTRGRIDPQIDWYLILSLLTSHFHHVEGNLLRLVFGGNTVNGDVSGKA